jgi:hypothetical protein
MHAENLGAEPEHVADETSKRVSAAPAGAGDLVIKAVIVFGDWP